MSYKLKKDFNHSSIVYIKFNGKKIGNFSGVELPSKEYSLMLKAHCASFYYVQLFNNYEGKGHFINAMSLLTQSLSDKFDKLIVRCPLKKDEWTGLASKLKELGNISSFSFEKKNESFLILNLINEKVI